jgi:hypothetical protein
MAKLVEVKEIPKGKKAYLVPVDEVVSSDDQDYGGRVTYGSKGKQVNILPTTSQFQDRVAYNPTSDMSTTQRTLAGVGKGMTDIVRGTGQRLREGAELISPPSKGLGDLITGNQGKSFADFLGLPTQADIDETKRLDAPLMNTTAGTVGNIAGQAALSLPLAFVPSANTYAGSGIVGSLLGAVQPTATGESVGTNIIGGGLGGVAGKYIGDKAGQLLVGNRGMNLNSSNSNASIGGSNAGASSTATGGATASGTGGGYNFGYVGDDLSQGLTDAQTAAMNKGKELGFKMTAGQATGSKALQQFEAKLESQPMTSGAFNEVKANNQKVLNRIAADAIGETADAVDSTVLASSLQRIGNVYKSVADKTPRQIDPDEFLNKISQVESYFEGLLPVSIVDNPLVKRLFNFANNGQATGEQLQNVASQLGRAAHKEMTTRNGDRELGLALFQVKDQVDDYLAKGLQGETLKAFQQARGQYRNLMLLTQRNGVLNPSSGDVSGNALAGLLQQKDRQGFLFGKNKSNLYEAARFAQAFRPIVGDSGTATRSPLPSPTDFLLSLPFSLATRAYTSSPAVSLATGISNAGRRGIAPFIDPRYAKSMPYAGLLGGSSIGANARE